MSASISNGINPTNFFTLLEDRVARSNSLLCIGLDPHLKELFPDGDVPENEETKCEAAYAFCKSIVDSTANYAAAYKPNAAFFKALGSKYGVSTLQRVIESIPEGIPVLLDVKLGDIGSTASAYAESCYKMKVDGVTLSPLMGWDSVEPFVTGKYSSKGAFLLCKTSNPGSDELLSLKLQSNRFVYEQIAILSKAWSNKGPTSSQPCFGLVVGATDTIALANVRKAVGPDVWILSPGVGTQGGNLSDACRAGMNHKGRALLVPVSREISRSKDRALKAKELKEMINVVREELIQLHNSSISKKKISRYQTEFIQFCLKQGTLKFGSFKLKSGRTSPYFFNAGNISNGSSLFKLGRAYAASIMASPELSHGGSIQFDVIFGPAYKGISLGAVVSSALYLDFDINVDFTYNRKEEKDHGEGGVLVGASIANKRILIVDDVITAGTAIRESYRILKRYKGFPMGVIIALDRAEKRTLDDSTSAVQSVKKDLGLPVVSIISLPQLQSFLEDDNRYGNEFLDVILKYRELYGVVDN